MDRGWILAHRTPGGHRRIERDSLTAFLKAHRMPVPSELGSPQRLLLISDSPALGQNLEQSLAQSGAVVELTVATGIVDAMLVLADGVPDYVVLDAALTGIEPVALCEQLTRSARLATAQLYVLRDPQHQDRDAALLASGVSVILDAPLEPESLAAHLRAPSPARLASSSR